ncbi:MAG TPA: ZIP family metal transporter [Acidimicrobiales bacterium]|nr:ZIP family metal transporter [Acidimicrobiales bacterium]
MVILVALATVASTAAGGLFALRFRDRLHLVLGFTAGVILGVVAFDVLPEIFDLVRHLDVSVRLPMGALVVAFLAFHVLEKSLLIHAAHEDEYGEHHEHAHGLDQVAAHGHDHGHPTVGLASALALCAHSFADGLGIGLAFQVDTRVGVAVALAVVAHDFADGLNTVGLMLRHGNDRTRALRLLALDALAPLAGAALTLAVDVPQKVLLVSLGAFAGFLLYIGAADILPEAHANHPSWATLLTTISGTALMFLVIGALPA